MNYEQRLREANVEFFANGNFARIGEFFAPSYVVHADGSDHQGHAFISRFLGQLRTAIPDISVVNLVILSTAGNKVTWERTLRGTHRKAMRGIVPSDQEIEWREMVVSQFDGELIVEEWLVSGLLGQLLLSR